MRDSNSVEALSAREARLTAREQDADVSRCLMALLPPETKIQIISYIST
ncbi:uncharacterized protein CPUR_05634 [Claviceps purpurea 20.1]|uniref:Uncharacterized protein n=1 Tax=Claviceps purpurea (strain 20.1) TaxID=1111077 RepID=M1WGG4_CLAP2|nr:uncharacterized protein CPUR_05634 [Claviceps purpurea 20.1]